MVLKQDMKKKLNKNKLMLYDVGKSMKLNSYIYL